MEYFLTSHKSKNSKSLFYFENSERYAELIYKLGKIRSYILFTYQLYYLYFDSLLCMASQRMYDNELNKKYICVL